MTHSNTALRQMLKYLDREYLQHLDQEHFPPIDKYFTKIRLSQFAADVFKQLKSRTSLQKKANSSGQVKFHRIISEETYHRYKTVKNVTSRSGYKSKLCALRASTLQPVPSDFSSVKYHFTPGINYFPASLERDSNLYTFAGNTKNETTIHAVTESIFLNI
jgi:hypothetical protein